MEAKVFDTHVKILLVSILLMAKRGSIVAAW